MKQILLIAGILLANVFGMQAQGLENVIVEKYYISDANDTTVNSLGGVLPVGSVTYRIYLDMLPDYIFQSAYGDPNHELRIETTTLFFNNEDRGAIHPTFNFNYCDDNTVMLDSWLSVGAACNGRFGVLKSEDNGVGTVVNSDGVLQNNVTAMGIPLTQEDGLLQVAGLTPEPVVTVGIGNEITVFDAQNDGTNGPVFSTTNGAWASVNGSSGPDAALNQVLIAQITTDGDLYFQMNVQIRNQTTLAVENYVASNPSGNEILFSALTYSSIGSGIPNSVYNPTFSLYPNPAAGQVTIATSLADRGHHSTYNIYDVLGNLVTAGSLGTMSGAAQRAIDISEITPGIYFVEMTFDNQKVTRKLIIQ